MHEIDLRFCFVQPLQGAGELISTFYLGLRASRSTLGSNIQGFQPMPCTAFCRNPSFEPAVLSGLKAHNVIAWAGASPTSEGPGQPSK